MGSEEGWSGGLVERDEGAEGMVVVGVGSRVSGR